MDNHKTEIQAFIERRVRNALALNALKRIRQIVDKIESDDRKARIAVYLFVLLFAALAIALFLVIAHTSR